MTKSRSKKIIKTKFKIMTMLLFPLMLVQKSIWIKFYATRKDFSSKDCNLKKENKTRDYHITDLPSLPTKKPKILSLRDHMESFLKMRSRRILTRLANSYHSNFPGKQCNITTMNYASWVKNLSCSSMELRSSLSKGSSLTFASAKIYSEVTVNQEVSRI